MRKRLIFVVAILLAVVAAGFYLWLPGAVPRNQKPLVKLTPVNVTKFEAAFNQADDMPRLVLLLSPT